MQSHTSSQVGAGVEQTQTENRKYVMTGAAAGGEGEEPHTQNARSRSWEGPAEGAWPCRSPGFSCRELLPDFWPPEL